MVIGDVLPALMAGLRYTTKGPVAIAPIGSASASLDVGLIPLWERMYPAETISPWLAAVESYNVRPLRVYSTIEILQSHGFPAVSGNDLATAKKCTWEYVHMNAATLVFVDDIAADVWGTSLSALPEGDRHQAVGIYTLTQGLRRKGNPRIRLKQNGNEES